MIILYVKPHRKTVGHKTGPFVNESISCIFNVIEITLTGIPELYFTARTFY